MVLAVLEARAGLSLAGRDVYLNVAGGLRLTEPAADLAAAVALVSALTGERLPAEAVFFGEISLSGAVRAVSQADARLKEAEKLGFTCAYVPPLPRRGGTGGLRLVEVADLSAGIDRLFDGARNADEGGAACN
jgi:DNA repair protein RadA/Sms